MIRHSSFRVPHRLAGATRIAVIAMLALLPVLAWAAPPAAALVPGVDYVDIPNGAPMAPRPGKIEVVEVFGYTCPHCAAFEPVFEQWKSQQASDVNVIPVPAPFGGYWIPYAQAFYAAQSMGLVDRTHQAVFRAIHEEHRLPIGGATPKEVAAFYTAYGVNAEKFAAAMTSKPIQAKLTAAREFLIRSEVDGTPSVVVAGKYRVTGKNFQDVLRITDALVSRERAAMAPRKR